MSVKQSLAALDVTQRNQLETLLMEFDQDWRPDSLPDVWARLDADGSEDFRRLVLAELVKIDLQRRWSAGEGQLLDEYLGRFPALGQSDEVDADLILVEYESRRTAEPELDLQSYADRFPEQFAELSRLVEEAGASAAGVPAASIETSRIAGAKETVAPRKTRSEEVPEEFGRYRIVRELGSGAMGTVYLALDTQLDRQVALKTPNFSGDKDEDLITRFYREARAAATLQHRNICPVFDVGEIDGRHFMSMGFIKGRSLQEFIKPDQLPPPRTAAMLIHRLASALAEAHRHNVIHRDLKPANIMIDLKREPVVMDFGLARKTDTETRVTQSGMLVGTPAYMSPEQVTDDQEGVGPAADIYALGVILYELLTGDIPFRGSIAQVVHKIMSVEPTPPSEIRDGINPKLEAICAKMMAKSRDERYASMEDVAADLKAYLKGKPEQPGKKMDQPTGTAVENAESEAITETEALNAFFAAQAGANPMQTAVEPTVVPKPASAPQPKAKINSEKPGQPLGLWVGAGLSGIAAILLGIVFLFPTPHGTLRVETKGDLEGLEIEIDREAITLTDGEWDQTAGEHRLSLRLGDDLLRFDEQTKRFEFGERELSVTVVGTNKIINDTFEVVRDDVTVLKIELVENRGFAADSGELTSPAPDELDTQLESDAIPIGAVDLPAPHLVNQYDDRLEDETSQYDQGRFYAVGLTPDGYLVDTATEDASVRVRDLLTGQQLKSPLDLVNLSAITWSADGSRIATGMIDGDVQVWRTGETVPEWTFEIEPAEAAENPGHAIRKLAFSADGSRLVACGSQLRGERQLIRAWGLDDGKRFPTIEARSRSTLVNQRRFNVDVSPDGSLVAVASGNNVQLWNVTTGELKRTLTSDGEQGPSLTAQRAETFAVAFSPDGGRVVWSDDRRVRISDVSTGELLLSRDSGGLARAVVFSPDGKRVAISTTNNFQLWDAATGEPLVQWSHIGVDESWNGTRHLVFTPDGRNLISAGYWSPLCVWDLEGQRAEERGWVELLAALDPTMAAARWAKSDMGWRVTRDDGLSVLTFEHRPAGGYELQTTVRFPLVTARGGVSTMSINLPVADRSVTLRLNGTELALRLIDGQLVDVTSAQADLGQIDRNRSYQFGILVQPNGADAQIRVNIDSQPIIDWSGPIAAISMDNGWERFAPEDDQGALGVMAHKGNPVFELLRLREFGTGRDQDQRATAERILELGGWVEIAGQRITEPGSLPDGTVRVTKVWFIDVELDEELKLLRDLPDLEKAHLSSMPITQNGFKHLGELTQIDILWLARTNVTNDDLRHLAGMTQLQQLYLHLTEVSDDGLQHLTGLRNLELLKLVGTPVTDEGSRLISTFSNLTNLDMTGTRITDESLASFSALGKLEWLRLARTEVTDAGLEHLETLTGLSYLDLEGTQVTSTGVAALQEKLPDCQIVLESTSRMALS